MSKQVLRALQTAYTLVNTMDPMPEGDADEVGSFHDDLKQMHQFCGQITAYVQGIASASFRPQEDDGELDDTLHNGSGVWEDLPMDTELKDVQLTQKETEVSISSLLL
jgi:hypothetical protein